MKNIFRFGISTMSLLLLFLLGCLPSTSALAQSPFTATVVTAPTGETTTITLPVGNGEYPGLMATGTGPKAYMIVAGGPEAQVTYSYSGNPSFNNLDAPLLLGKAGEKVCYVMVVNSAYVMNIVADTGSHEEKSYPAAEDADIAQWAGTKATDVAKANDCHQGMSILILTDKPLTRTAATIKSAAEITPAMALIESKQVTTTASLTGTEVMTTAKWGTETKTVTGTKLVTIDQKTLEILKAAACANNKDLCDTEAASAPQASDMVIASDASTVTQEATKLSAQAQAANAGIAESGAFVKYTVAELMGLYPDVGPNWYPGYIQKQFDDLTGGNKMTVDLEVDKDQILIMGGSSANIPGIGAVGGKTGCFLLVIGQPTKFIPQPKNPGEYNSIHFLAGQQVAWDLHSVDPQLADPTAWALAKALRLELSYPDTCGKAMDIYVLGGAKG